MALKRRPAYGEVCGAVAFVVGVMLVAAGQVDAGTDGGWTKGYVGAALAAVGVAVLIVFRRRRS